ncbi:MAG: prepilin-type N-terminal cleavage/methylation domain-containing protein [Nanobdellota archaeon]
MYKKKLIKQHGFTLVELLITLAVSGIILGVVVQVMFSNQKVIKKIDEVNKMRSEARSAMYVIEDHVRLAGFDPGNSFTSSAPVITAQHGVFEFFMKKLNDISKEDKVRIGLSKSGDCGYSGCSDFDGIAESGSASLVVNSQNTADNVAAVRFAYAFDNDDDGLLDTQSNEIIWSVDSTGNGYLDIVISDSHVKKLDPEVKIEKIRAVKIWLLTRTRNQVDEDNAQKFIIGADISEKSVLEYVPDDKNYTYYLLTNIVRCRNLGG